MTHKNGDPPVI